MRKTFGTWVSTGMGVAFAAMLLGAGGAEAAIDLSADDYRVFCGYQDAVADPDIAKLKPKKRDRKIAKMAKMKVKALKAAVAKGEAVGGTCAEIGKKVEAEAAAALKKALGDKIDFFELDLSDPSHVVASVRWKVGVRKKDIWQEAALVAYELAQTSPIVTTIAIRGVDPKAKDTTADAAVWLEAKISYDRAGRISKSSLKYAERRYKRLFDGVKMGK